MLCRILRIRKLLKKIFHAENRPVTDGFLFSVP